MGMFDVINYKMKCPVCGNEIPDFQSKDKDCTLSKLKLYEVDNFYSPCHKCGTWIEFNLKVEARKKFTIEDYEMEVRREENPKIVECSNCNKKVIPLFIKVCSECDARIID